MPHTIGAFSDFIHHVKEYALQFLYYRNHHCHCTIVDGILTIFITPTYTAIYNSLRAILDVFPVRLKLRWELVTETHDERIPTQLLLLEVYHTAPTDCGG